jgi:hypothetical protein
MSKAKVLGPDEMIKCWEQALPDTVVETFNELLAKKFDGTSATIKHKELLSALNLKGVETKVVTEQNWLFQTKELYQIAGWKVVFQSPGWDDNFDSYFHFKLK